MAHQTDKTIHSVSHLNREAKQLLESQFSFVLIQGEISNFVRPGSGHFYFTLKDEKSQIRCAMFRGHQHNLNFSPENGQQVIVGAKLSIYEGRGDYQLIVSTMESAGDGALRQAFEALKKRLQQEGLFEDKHKKSIPQRPTSIGIVTSSTGAAVQDILTTLKRRFPLASVIIYPSQVQGATASTTICQAICVANARKECDILILARGGGSLEDLWPFNEENVARSIYQSQLPIITGIGHEIDFTIADFVADLRAPTPTAAAECITPNQNDLLNLLQQTQSQLYQAIQTQLQNHYQHIDYLEKRLKNPRQQLLEYQQRLKLVSHGLKKAQEHYLSQLLNQVAQSHQQLQHYSPQNQIQRYAHQLSLLHSHFNTMIKQQLVEKNNKLGQCITALDAISPLATLKRGYSIVTDSTSGAILRSAKDCSKGSTITATLSEGQLHCEVIETDY